MYIECCNVHINFCREITIYMTKVVWLPVMCVFHWTCVVLWLCMGFDESQEMFCCLHLHCLKFLTSRLCKLYHTEALKGHRVVWKIEICYLIRMTYEWKPMSSGWHNSIVVTHPDEIPISAKSSGWHTVYDMSSGWHTAVSKSHPDEIRPGANSSGWLRVQMTLCHPDEIGEYRKSSGWHPTMPISHPDVIPPIVKSSGWDTANS